MDSDGSRYAAHSRGLFLRCMPATGRGARHRAHVRCECAACGLCRAAAAARGLAHCRCAARRLQGARGRADQPVAAQRDRCGARFSDRGEGSGAGRSGRARPRLRPGDRTLFDPALPLEEQRLVDLLVRERAERKHVLGPALGADARDPCPSTCMHVYTAPGNATPLVRVKTETIRGR